MCSYHFLKVSEAANFGKVVFLVGKLSWDPPSNAKILSEVDNKSIINANELMKIRSNTQFLKWFA